MKALFGFGILTMMTLVATAAVSSKPAPVAPKQSMEEMSRRIRAQVGMQPAIQNYKLREAREALKTSLQKSRAELQANVPGRRDELKERIRRDEATLAQVEGAIAAEERATSPKKEKAPSPKPSSSK